MDSNKPLVLVVNDDGIDSPGLIELAHQCRSIGDVLIVAPQTSHSGASRPHPYSSSYGGTGEIEMRSIELSPGDVVTAFAVNGTPNAAALHGIFELSNGRRPSLCVSGINFMENVGNGIYASGTIAAALEAADRGIPAIAISQQLPPKANRPSDWVGLRKMFSVAGKIAATLGQKIISNNCINKSRLCLNVNVPAGATLDTQIVYANIAPNRLWEWLPFEREDSSLPGKLEYGLIGELAHEPNDDSYELHEHSNVTVTAITSSMQDYSADIGAIEALFDMR